VAALRCGAELRGDRLASAWSRRGRATTVEGEHRRNAPIEQSSVRRDVISESLAGALPA
jgi:hypothetical protein